MNPDQLDADVYRSLRHLAARIHHDRVHARDSIQPTALLHEAWMKISGKQYASRAHFMAVAAKAMRQILVDRVRERMAQKRGSGVLRTTLTGVNLSEQASPVDVLALHQALQALEAVDARAARIATMLTFGGMTVPEIADVEQQSTRSIWRVWRYARTFIITQLEG